MVQVIPVSITGNTSLFPKYTSSIARVYPFTFWYLGSHNCMDNKCSIIRKQAMYLILNTKRYQEISLTISCLGGLEGSGLGHSSHTHSWWFRTCTQQFRVYQRKEIEITYISSSWKRVYGCIDQWWEEEELIFTYKQQLYWAFVISAIHFNNALNNAQQSLWRVALLFVFFFQRGIEWAVFGCKESYWMPTHQWVAWQMCGWTSVWSGQWQTWSGPSCICLDLDKISPFCIGLILVSSPPLAS